VGEDGRVSGIEVVVAHAERATVRVGEVFLKIDADPERATAELAAMRAAPVPTPEVLWHRPPVIALAALRGRALGRLGQPSTASAGAWAATGAALRALHDTSPPADPPGKVSARSDVADRIAQECAWLVDHEVLPHDLVERGRRLAEKAVRPFEPVFVHGDLQVEHVFVDGDAVTGILDWSEAGPGDATYDLAVLALGNRDRLAPLLEGYAGDVDPELVRAQWALRSLTAIQWLLGHGFDPFAPGCEVDVLREVA
jgi:aminoglycoside phosphotransferase (APT) family kinase protein